MADNNKISADPLKQFLADPFDEEYRLRRRHVLLVSLLLVIAGLSGGIAYGPLQIQPDSALPSLVTKVIGGLAVVFLCYSLWQRAWECFQRWRHAWETELQVFENEALYTDPKLSEKFLNEIKARNRSVIDAELTKKEKRISDLHAQREKDEQELISHRAETRPPDDAENVHVNVPPAKPIEKMPSQDLTEEALLSKLTVTESELQSAQEEKEQLLRKKAVVASAKLSLKDFSAGSFLDDAGEVLHLAVEDESKLLEDLIKEEIDSFARAPLRSGSTPKREYQAHVRLKQLSETYFRGGRPKFTLPVFVDTRVTTYIAVISLGLFLFLFTPRTDRDPPAGVTVSTSDAFVAESRSWRWLLAQRIGPFDRQTALFVLDQTPYTLSFPIFENREDRKAASEIEPTIREILSEYIERLKGCLSPTDFVSLRIVGYADGKTSANFSEENNVQLANDRADYLSSLLPTDKRIRRVGPKDPRDGPAVIWVAVQQWADDEHNRMRQGAGFIDFSSPTGSVNRRADIVFSDIGGCTAEEIATFTAENYSRYTVDL